MENMVYEVLLFVWKYIKEIDEIMIWEPRRTLAMILIASLDWGLTNTPCIQSLDMKVLSKPSFLSMPN
jgi:hypothetical protein